MFRLTACLAFARTGLRLKTAAPFHMLRFRTPGHQEPCSGGRLLFDDRIFEGEFMRSFIFIVACVVALSASPVIAGETPDTQAVRIEMDQEAKAFIFIIDDEPVAVLDKNGLNVVAHIGYGGHLTDKGRESVRREISALKEGGRADD